MSVVAINMKAYDKALKEDLMALISHSEDRSSKSHNVDRLRREVYRVLGQERDLRERSLIQDLLRSGPGNFSLAMDLSDYQESLNPSDNTSRLKESVSRTRSATLSAMKDVVTLIQGAIRRVDPWHKTPVMVSPEFSKGSDLGEARTSAYIKMGRHNLGFTLFDKEDGSYEVEDLLEVGDTDFFKSPEESSDYYNLVQEIRVPGSTKKGKDIVLYTARPMKDRPLLDGASSIPPNLFLTTSLDAAEGLARDLASSGVRDLYRVVVNSKYLLMTLDRGRVREYQVVGKERVPVKSIELIDEGVSKLARLASCMVQKVAKATGWDDYFIGYHEGSGGGIAIVSQEDFLAHEDDLPLAALVTDIPQDARILIRFTNGKPGVFESILKDLEIGDQIYDDWSDLNLPRISKGANGKPFEFKGPLDLDAIILLRRKALNKVVPELMSTLLLEDKYPVGANLIALFEREFPGPWLKVEIPDKPVIEKPNISRVKWSCVMRANLTHMGGSGVYDIISPKEFKSRMIQVVKMALLQLDRVKDLNFYLTVTGKVTFVEEDSYGRVNVGVQFIVNVAS